MAEAPVRKFRFGVRDLLLVQLILSPLFLAVPYANYQNRAHQFDPIKALVWILVPPLLYVFWLVVIRLRKRARRSFVFSGIRLGLFFGLLFGVLSWGPVGIPPLCRAIFGFFNLLSVASRRGIPITVGIIAEVFQVTLRQAALLSGFLVVHYAVFGIAAGAMAGIIMQRIEARKSRVQEPERSLEKS